MRAYLRLLTLGSALALSLCLGLGGSFSQNADDKKEAKKDDSKKDDKKTTEEPDPFDNTNKRPYTPNSEEQILTGAGLKTDTAALLAFFRDRTLDDTERPKLAALISQLGSDSYREREKAMTEIIRRGPVAVELLRTTTSDNLEVTRRVEKCLRRIQEKDVAVDVPEAAVRLLGKRQPPETVDTLLAFLPFADNDTIADEVRQVLTRVALDKGKAHASLIAGLSDKMAVRRASAGEVLARAGAKDQHDQIRKLLADRDALVRLRVALALVDVHERSAVPVLIDSLPDFSLHQAWQAEDVLFRLAEGKSPPMVSLGQDEDTRKKCRAAWQDWWKKNGDQIDLAKLQQQPKLLGYTLVVLLDMNKIVELDAQNRPRWEIDNLVFPLDVQMIGEDRVLVAEYHAGKVTERDLKGKVLWEKDVGGPLVAQRLRNGNTFIGADSLMVEYDKDGKEVFSHQAENGERFMKMAKLPNGEIAVLTTDARVVRLDSHGKELHSYSISLGSRLFGGRIHMLPSGRVIIPHNAENKVIEYDAKGKVVWEANVDAPVAATRLPNGNTLVTTMQPHRGAVELDRSGNEVWNYRASTRVTRALRR